MYGNSGSCNLSSFCSSLLPPLAETHRCVAAMWDPKVHQVIISSTEPSKVNAGHHKLALGQTVQASLQNVSHPLGARVLSKPDSQSQHSWKQLACSAAITRALVDSMPSRTDELPCISQVWACGGQWVEEDQISCTFFLCVTTYSERTCRRFLFSVQAKGKQFWRLCQNGWVCSQLSDMLKSS